MFQTISIPEASIGGDRWLVAEHVYDATDDLSGDGWHGVMAYTWFTRPVWRWLARPGSALMGQWYRSLLHELCPGPDPSRRNLLGRWHGGRRRPRDLR